MATEVRITNTYPDRTNSRTVTVTSPELYGLTPDRYGLTPDVLMEDWWNESVLPETGDGHGESQYATYEAEIVSSDVPGITGLTHAWEG